MENEIVKVLAELIEQSSQICESFVNAEIYLKNGDLINTQKFTKKGQDLLATCVNDVFVELAEEIGEQTDDYCDIEDISTLEIVKHLNNSTYNAGALLGLLCEDVPASLTQSVKMNILKALNSVIKLNLALFAN